MAAEDWDGSPDSSSGIGLEKSVRGAQAVLGFCIVSGLVWGWMCFRLQDAKTGAGLADTVNPNTASMGSLIRLEGIGPVRALKIIQYREQTETAGFRNPEEMENVPGIGPKTVSKIAPFLVFEQEQRPTTEEISKGQDGRLGD